MNDLHDAPAFADTDRPVQQDYFGFQATEKFHLPDGLSWIEFRVMNEGDKLKFQKKTGRDINIDRRSGDARIKMDPGTERHELIITCCVNWNLTRNGELVPFGDRSIRDFLELANPRVVEDLEKAIRKANPWLLGEMTVEDIDKEIADLQEMRVVVSERERGEASSASR
jgi:hypothetical protein